MIRRTRVGRFARRRDARRPASLRSLPIVVPVLVLLLLQGGYGRAGGIDARAVGEVAPAEAAAVVVVRHRADFPVMGILGLADDRFVLWNGDGRMQTGTAAGDWTKTFRVAVHAIVDLKSDGHAFLVVGALDVNVAAVLRVGADGNETARWTLPSGAYALAVDAQGRAASTRAGLVPLLDGGTLGKPIPWPGPAQEPHGELPKVIRRGDGATVTCVTRNLSMQHRAPGHCDRLGKGGWRFEGDFGPPFVGCGDSLIVIEGARPWRITAYSMVSGKRGMEIRTSVRPALACIKPGDLLVADRRLSVFRLPGTKPIWTAKKGASAPISDVALTEKALAYRADDSADVVIIPRP